MTHCDTDISLLSFGFEDGISQPLLKDVDLDEAWNKDVRMQTKQGIITVTNPNGQQRPPWMSDGSFLVFRKLDQNVGAFRDLIKQPFTTPLPTGFTAASQMGCKSEAQLGAKLMGRWPSGRLPASSRHPVHQYE